WPQPIPPTAAYGQRLHYLCDIDVDPPKQVCAPDGTTATLSGSCDTCEGTTATTATTARIAEPAPGSTTLVVDRARSYVSFTTPFQTVLVPVAGDGRLDLPSGQLQTLRLNADDAFVGGSQWSGWTFALEGPVQLQRTGDAFAIPVARQTAIVGTGRRDGALVKQRSVATGDIAGHLNVADKTFDVDFSDQSIAGT